MNKKLKLAALSILLMGIGFLGTAAINPEIVTDPVVETNTSTTMVFKQTEIAIGEVALGVPVDITFELVNEGNEPLIIESVKPSCGCTGVDYPKVPVMPGESASITATYNAKKSGAFSKTVTVYSNAAETAQVLKFSGTVK